MTINTLIALFSNKGWCYLKASWKFTFRSALKEQQLIIWKKLPLLIRVIRAIRGWKEEKIYLWWLLSQLDKAQTSLALCSLLQEFSNSRWKKRFVRLVRFVFWDILRDFYLDFERFWGLKGRPEKEGKSSLMIAPILLGSRVVRGWRLQARTISSCSIARMGSEKVSRPWPSK